MTYTNLLSAIKAVVFPKGEAENLVAIHNGYIRDALIEIQKHVPCYQADNTNVADACSTYYKCGVSVVTAPDGFVKRVYTVDSDNFCCKIDYLKATRQYIEEMAALSKAEFGPFTQPDQTGKPVLDLGYKYAGDESDSTSGRALRGYYAFDNGKLYVYPWLQSTESLVVEWNGVKTTYSGSDTVFDGDNPVLQRAVRHYLQREVARDLTCDNDKLVKYSQAFADDLGELIWWCRQKTEGFGYDKAKSTIVGVCSTAEENTP